VRGRRATRRSPIAASIVLGVAVGVFGVAFGVLASTSGLSVAQACAMSLLVFTGASQFLAVQVTAGGGTPAAAVAGALLLAARNGVYGMAMARVVQGSLPRRLLAAHFVLDESTAMASAQETPDDRRRAFWATGVAVFVAWNAGTLVGAVAGRGIGDPGALGLDAAFPAGFVALLLPHLRTRPGRWAAGLGAAVAVALVPVTPAGVPILAASAATLVGLRVRP
jgi:4-azaleucine resistance transporter AzlC